MSRYSNVKEMIQDRIELHASYVRVFFTPDGQRILRHLMREGHITKSTFVAGDPHRTALNEGKRLMVLSILRFLHKDHKQMIKEIEKGIEDEA